MLMRNELYACRCCGFQDQELRNGFLSRSGYASNPDTSYERTTGWRK